MTQKLTATDAEAMPGVLAAVLADPGLSNKELQTLLRHPEYRIRRCLSVLNRQGKLGLVRFGPYELPRWYPPAEAEMIRAKFEAEALDRKRERNKLYARRRNAALRAGLVEDKDDGMPIRRTRDAHAPLPFVCNAPRSVFELGSA